MTSIDRRDFLYLVAAGLANGTLASAGGCSHDSAPQKESTPPASPATQEERPPNIVYILADDLGYGDLGCYNPESKIPTPNIDRLAAEGIRFTDAHSASAVCTPTRYGILTGRYAWRSRLKSGVLWGYSPPLIEKDQTTVASLLKQAGYATGCVGKWHLGLGWQTPDGRRISDSADEAPTDIQYDKVIAGGPTELGFDYFFGIPASLDMVPYVYIENDRTVAAPTEEIEATKDLAFYRGGPIAPGFKHNEVLSVLTQKSIAFIDQQAKKPKQPFFLYFPLTAPHTPVLPNESARGRSKAGDYGDFVVQCDDLVGQILQTLEKHGMRENTLVIITSDNGSTLRSDGESYGTDMSRFGHLPNGNLAGRKSDIWDGGHRVPFVARWPKKIQAGSQSDQLMCLTDLVASVASIAGVALPADSAPDSYDLSPIFEGESPQHAIRDSIVHHAIGGMFSIRRGPWKLILGKGSGGWTSPGSPEDPPGQLYHVGRDFSETQNLYSKHPDIVAELTQLLEKFQKEERSVQNRPLSQK